MKYKYILFVTVGLTVFYGLTTFAKLQTNSSPFKLTAKSDKQTYFLGEVVHLTFELKNESEKDAFIGEVFGTGSGSVTVHISKDGKTFPEYNPGWGQVDFVPVTTTIKPDESLTSSADILWHLKPNAFAGESKESAKEIAKKTILTDYAFPEPGTYFIKLIFSKTLESEPIKITLNKPVGEDLEVWNLIKIRGDIAFFIQFNYLQISDYQTEEREKFLSEISQIIIDHPNSFYVEILRQSLNKFRDAETKRQEFKRNLQRQ